MPGTTGLAPETKYRLLLEISQKISRTLELPELLKELRGLRHTPPGLGPLHLRQLRPQSSDVARRGRHAGILRGSMRGPAREMIRSVIEATRAYTGRDGYDDDFTLVVVKRDRPGRVE